MRKTGETSVTASAEPDALPASGVTPRREDVLLDARVVAAGCTPARLGPDAKHALEEVVAWFDGFVNRPHPGLGRTGEVCPWTRHTMELGNLVLTPVASTDPDEVDATFLGLLDRFLTMEPRKGPDAAFRSLIGVFHGLARRDAAAFVVAAHQRLKPIFLDHGLMLGEFYPTCPKPGLRNPDFRPLQSPVPLMVIRSMIEADVEFLLDGDDFIDAYLRTHRARGLDRLTRLLEQRPASLTAERTAHLLELCEGYREVLGPPSRPLNERPSRSP